MVRTWLLHAVGIGPGMLLSFLITWGERLKRFGKTTDGWFYVTVETVERCTAIPARSQSRYLGHLQERGLIEVNIKHCPNRRYIRIAIDRVNELIDDQREKYDAAPVAPAEIQFTDDDWVHHPTLGECTVFRINDDGTLVVFDEHRKRHTVHPSEVTLVNFWDDEIAVEGGQSGRPWDANLAAPVGQLGLP
jgi:hypothetical protein